MPLLKRTGLNCISSPQGLESREEKTQVGGLPVGGPSSSSLPVALRCWGEWLGSAAPRRLRFSFPFFHSQGWLSRSGLPGVFSARVQFNLVEELGWVLRRGKCSPLVHRIAKSHLVQMKSFDLLSKKTSFSFSWLELLLKSVCSDAADPVSSTLLTSEFVCFCCCFVFFVVCLVGFLKGLGFCIIPPPFPSTSQQ